VASSTFLAEKFAGRGLRVAKVPNACTVPAEGTVPIFGQRREAPVRKWDCPPPLAQEPGQPAAGQQPVLGYVGCLGQWFDWPLVVRLAEQLPQASIELVGPCAVRPPVRLPPNIRLLPPCPQDAVDAQLARFSAGLIPFRPTALTAGVDPIKFYDYRAAGLPVLTTTFGEMALRGPDDGVYFLDQADDLPALVCRALHHPFDAAAIEQFRAQHNWQARFRQADPFSGLANPAPRGVVRLSRGRVGAPSHGTSSLDPKLRLGIIASRDRGPKTVRRRHKPKRVSLPSRRSPDARGGMIDRSHRWQD